MKQSLFKVGFLGLAMTALVACEQGEEVINPQNEVICDAIDFENGTTDGFISEISSVNGTATVQLYNRARTDAGVLTEENRAHLFETGMPTGDDDDLYTDTWGKALIIQELGVNDEPNDNQWGGEMMLTFSEAVTLESVNVLDVDTYEDNSWVYLYDASGNELYNAMLQPLGNNSQQTVNLGNTAGVKTMKIVLAGTEGYVGSGAIDDIKFCVTRVIEVPEEPEQGCTRTQGYWKNHADPGKKQYNSTWDNYLEATFYSSGMTYLQVLNTPPQGDAYFILAHQYIAAELNVAAGASMPTDVKTAYNTATAYFKGEKELSREEMVTIADLLDDYNNGKTGPGHCED
ncbi:hypothetical protein H7F15_17690 [Pontibacter sp. Tf4]|uniref:hypothetical protein n=1 Tax=Pontibacter sp. Tf4 TaxID=2761620 RepID=UPI0016280433|nr:hypothetical protein [Pontibacter sp. Tf4]MBB6612879.1 hypothetical protein [Pontibacter sp. Tf4]